VSKPLPHKEPVMTSLGKTAGSIFDFVLAAFAFLSGAILAFLMFAVCWDVIARAVAGKPLQWVLEYSEYGLLYMCFLSTAWVLKKDRHVVSDLLLVALSRKTQAIFNTITSLMGGVVCLILTYIGWGVAWEKLQTGSYEPTIMQPPDFPLYLVIPVGFLLLTIQFARRARKHIEVWKADSGVER
jgi:TRAP-type C4-dicarboxylate transport system permease small subunit